MMVKVYSASLINKPLRSINKQLRKKIASDLKKCLRVSNDVINSQEMNTFILVSGERNGETEFDNTIIDQIEKGIIRQRYSKYYNKTEKKFKRNLKLKNNQELRETSQIVKDFIKEIDSGLSREFSKRLQGISEDLPQELKELSCKSFITLWDFNGEYRFFLSGFDFPVFTGKTTDTQMNVGSLVDKLIIINFMSIFLKPTISRLERMKELLTFLGHEIAGTHYKTDNPQLQRKSELFFRILVAKLSALQELDNLIYRIFNLFEIPRMLISQHNLKGDYQDFNTVLARINSDIEDGKSLLQEVSTNLQKCQISLRDYMEEGVNGVKTLNVSEFKTTIKPFAELSVDLFVEAELLKIWSDFFGMDIPYFSFNTQFLGNSKQEETIEVDEDSVLSVRGLFKNYNLGQTTVYAIRGVNLDIKEGEFIAILGDSGAGKTTLLNCMAGLDSPDHGKVIFRGEDLHKMDDSKKSKARLLEMGFIFQSYALLPHFNTRENVALPADLAGMSGELKERIEELLEGVGIEGQAKQFPAQLSGGQMQRVAIARALTNRPSIIFADEPTGDLDSGTGKQVMELLKKFHEETKTTVIIITHEQEIADYAQRKYIMEDGIITGHDKGLLM